MRISKNLFIFGAAFLFGTAAPAVMASAYAETVDNEMYAEEVVSETVEYFEDGSYLTITVKQEVGIMPCGTVYEKSGSKSGVYRNKDGKEAWRFTVHGTFSVNSGVSATCTKTSYKTNITNSEWELSSASTYASGNQAVGDATFVKKQNGSAIETKSSHITITCDENGNLK